MKKEETPTQEYIVYMHISPNNKKYIGITKCPNPNRRWKDGKGYWSNQHFLKAIKKYGWENFEHKILYKNLKSKEAEEKERELIKYYKSDDRNFGYNIESGGMLRKEVSQETREKLKIKATGKKASVETREKMSQARKGNKNYWYGKHLSEKTKQKLSEQKKKKILQYTKDGEYIQTFNSITEAARKYGVTRQSITSNLTQKRKSSCGYIWRYANG